MGSERKKRKWPIVDYKKKRRILYLIKCVTDKRGKQNEKNVDEALEALKTEGKILGFKTEDQWSRRDRRAIDRTITLNDHRDILLDVKSSLAGVERFFRKQEELKQRGVRVDSNKRRVFIGAYLAGESPEEFKERLYECLTG